MQDCGQCVALTHRNAFCLTVGLQGALAIHEGGVVKSDGWGLPLPLLTGDSDGSVSATPLASGADTLDSISEWLQDLLKVGRTMPAP